MRINFYRASSAKMAMASLVVVGLFMSSAFGPRIVYAATDLTEMSLEDLMNTEVASVSKKAQSKNDAAAAITVITSEDLRRGGFTSIPEALRIVPGIQVARIDGNRWAISARGSSQEFANKLLVMIDGRSVYTPLFGGVYWDIQDYPIEDIERIEVIRGPGGTIWGPNAVNGVINVITKHSGDTQGALLSGYGGSQEYGATGRFGMKLGEKTSMRVFGKGFEAADQDVSSRHDAKDSWNHIRGGFRLDSSPTEKDEVRVSADYYHVDRDNGLLNLSAAPNVFFSRRNSEAKGGNAVVNWNHKTDDSGTFTAKAFYERNLRDADIEEDRHTADVEIQHDVTFNEGGDYVANLTWGLNYRYSTSHIKGISTLSLLPNDEDFHLANGFVQGQLDLLDNKLALIAGIKLGGNNWSGFDYQPSGRILIKPAEGHTLWGAVSRAVRNPTQLDRNLFAVLPSTAPPFAIVLAGNDRQRSEELLSLELGYRFFQFERLTAEVSFFHNQYENASTLSVIPTVLVPGLTTFSFGNEGEFTTTGAEIEVNVMPLKWWRLTLGYTVLETEADIPPSPLGAGSRSSVVTDNPKHQVVVRNFFDLPAGFELDATVYWVDGLRDVVTQRIPPTTRNVESYVRLDLRIGYKPADWIELSLVGQNLTDARHLEFSDVQSNLASEVPRSGYGKVTLRF